MVSAALAEDAPATAAIATADAITKSFRIGVLPCLRIRGGVVVRSNVFLGLLRGFDRRLSPRPNAILATGRALSIKRQRLFARAARFHARVFRRYLAAPPHSWPNLNWRQDLRRIGEEDVWRSPPPKKIGR